MMNPIQLFKAYRRASRLAGLRALQRSAAFLVVRILRPPLLEVVRILRTPQSKAMSSTGEATTPAVALRKCILWAVWMPLRAVRLVLGVMSFLLKAIVIIVLRRAEKQVFRPHASGVVAVVTDKHAGRDLAVRQFPRHSMRGDSTAAHAKSAVAERVSGRSPFPAATGALVDLTPEASIGWCGRARVPTAARTEARGRIYPSVVNDAAPFTRPRGCSSVDNAHWSIIASRYGYVA